MQTTANILCRAMQKHAAIFGWGRLDEDAAGTAQHPLDRAFGTKETPGSWVPWVAGGLAGATLLWTLKKLFWRDR